MLKAAVAHLACRGAVVEDGHGRLEREVAAAQRDVDGHPHVLRGGSLQSLSELE